MESTETVVQKWLRQTVAAYLHRDRAYADVDRALTGYPALRPKSDIYTYDDGRTQLLLCIHGLLPINFRGAAYNIPINVWITREYPTQPPIVYVVPTGDMLVRPGKFLEVSGRSNSEYMQQWERKSEGCNLLGLLEGLQHQFSNDPPVYAKPRETTPPPAPVAGPVNSSLSPAYSSRPPPPLPGVARSPPPAPATPLGTIQQVPQSPNRPVLPPKPGLSAEPIRPVSEGEVRPPSYHQPQIASSPAPPTNFQSRYSSPGPPPPPPPAPPAPPRPAGYVHHGQGLHISAFQPSHPQQLTPPQPQPQPHVRASSPQPPAPPPLPLNMPPTIQSMISSPPPPPPPPPLPPIPSSPHQTSPPAHPPYMHQQHHVPPPLPQPQPQPVAPPVPAHPRVLTYRPQPSIPPPNFMDEETPSALTSLHPSISQPFLSPANAPPRPPNPELLDLHSKVHSKITMELASLTQAFALDAERLRAIQSDLLAGDPAIRDEMARLEAVRDVCENVANRYRGAVQAAEANVGELRRKGDPEVDELVCSTTIVHTQLVDLVAEDNAIEDTIYHLSRALNSGRIDLERFLRTTRALAEEQFLKRALIEKIQIAMPAAEMADGSW